jgi:hypothetical protein
MAVWMALLEEASQADDRGDISGFDAESFDCLLGADDGETLRIMQAMGAKGLICEDMRLAGWDRRQPLREDSGNPDTGALSSTERSRLHRQRRKAQAEADTQRDATQCNDAKRNATQETARGEESRGEEISPTPPTAREGEFAMDLTWEPSDHFPTLARQAGAPAPTAEAVAEFRSYWIGQGAAMSQHQWDHKLLTNMKAQKLRGAQRPRKAKRPGITRPAPHPLGGQGSSSKGDLQPRTRRTRRWT